jgi:hypothetical protein
MGVSDEIARDIEHRYVPERSAKEPDRGGHLLPPQGFVRRSVWSQFQENRLPLFLELLLCVAPFAEIVLRGQASVNTAVPALLLRPLCDAVHTAELQGFDDGARQRGEAAPHRRQSGMRSDRHPALS